ncbi:hypothetical protein ACAG26_00710 [Mycobacterium sp. pUA109]|uniref:hypothetical protein n=1 Tax=Mycobacterium sp. pUA109 TaxID=3238982 RepID=UPI00351BD0F8
MTADTTTTAPPDDRKRRVWTWVNWALALLTAPAAALVMIVGLGAVMSTAACSTAECPNLGPSGFMFNVMYYGAPAVAAATILLSFFTASRRRGLIVPICGWALLLVDVIAITVSFNT